MRVYLIGFMGSGKSTFGKKLAAKLNMPFVDTDKAIEQAQGKTIPQIFSEYGEAYFRSLEAAFIRSTTEYTSALISCGGGTPCFNDNMDWMRENGITVYLKVPEEHLFQRLRTRTAKRPLLAGMDDDALRAYIRDMLQKRSAFYDRAHQIVDPTAVKPKFVADLLRKKMEH